MVSDIKHKIDLRWLHEQEIISLYDAACFMAHGCKKEVDYLFNVKRGKDDDFDTAYSFLCEQIKEVKKSNDDRYKLGVPSGGVWSVRAIDVNKNIYTIEWLACKVYKRGIAAWLKDVGIKGECFDSKPETEPEIAISSDANDSDGKLPKKARVKKWVVIPNDKIRLIFRDYAGDNYEEWVKWHNATPGTRGKLHDNESLIYYIKDICRSQLSCGQIARILGVSSQNVSNWRKGAENRIIENAAHRRDKHLLR